jgi:hypothetical protein
MASVGPDQAKFIFPLKKYDEHLIMKQMIKNCLLLSFETCYSQFSL